MILSKTTKAERIEERMEVVNKILELTYPKWDGSKFRKGMTLAKACWEVGIVYTTLKYWRDNHPEVEALFQTTNRLRMQILEDIAKENVYEALSGNSKLRPDKKADISLRLLEKVSDDFIPMQKFKVESNNTLNFDKPIDELQSKVMEIASQLNITNNSNE